MLCHEIPLFDSFLIGAGFGVFVYLLSRWRHKSLPDGVHTGESGACGVGIAAGFHLAYCACCPSLLAHLIDGNKNRLDGTDLFVKVGDDFVKVVIGVHIGEIHAIHIFLGGCTTAIVAGVGLYKFCKAPRAAPPPEESAGPVE